MFKKYNPKRTKFPLEIADLSLFGYLHCLKRAEDEVKAQQDFLIDDKIDDLISLLRYGLRVPESHIGNWILGMETLGPARFELYQNLFDPHAGERKDLQRKLKEVIRKREKIRKTKAENDGHHDELQTQKRELAETRKLLENMLESIGSPNHVSSQRTWNRTFTDDQAKKAKYAKFDKSINDEVRAPKGQKLRDHIIKERRQYRGALADGEVLSLNDWRQKWAAIRKLL